MRTHAFLASSCICAAVVVIFALSAVAGPLNPPAGPVAPTPGPEARIAIGPDTTPGNSSALFVIDEPGSYYLTGNIVGVAGKDGIRIGVDEVTLDLNGFTLTGVNGAVAGVRIEQLLPAGGFEHLVQNAKLRNGSIDGWQIGVDGAQGHATSYIDVNASHNSEVGLRGGFAATITNCIALLNGVGIEAQERSVIRDSVADLNSGDGIRGSFSSTVISCVSGDNGGVGISVGVATTVHGCTVQDNNGAGILAAENSYIFENSSMRNATGVSATGAGARIESNNLTNNSTGIASAGGAFIVKNSLRDNAVDFSLVISQNTIGPIITANGEITTTNPWANFVLLPPLF